ncbi:MAG TPA: hypothetical protein VMW95_09170, partial [Desulfobacterales bacterium]|nr:hypothetical protein [Desulfobacterales bacterium]
IFERESYDIISKQKLISEMDDLIKIFNGTDKAFLAFSEQMICGSPIAEIAVRCSLYYPHLRQELKSLIFPVIESLVEKNDRLVERNLS